MIVDNLLFHNVTSMIDAKGGGKLMLRIPEEVSEHINEKAQNMNLANCGMEIRFVMPEKGAVKIRLRYDPTLSTQSVETEGKETEKELKKTYVQAIVFYGGYAVHSINIPTEEKEFIFELPEDEGMRKRFYALCDLNKDYGYPFDTKCVRILLKDARSVIYCGAEGNIVPPTPDMMPDKKILMYGSSLTYGCFSFTALNSYASITAENLGFDLINLGLAGSCWAEKELIDYIATADWNVALLELGANMFNKFTEEQFKERVEYAVKKITSENPDKKVFFMSPFYQHRDIIGGEKIKTYRIIMENAVKGFENAVYLDGSVMMPDSSGLSCDLVHLSEKGAKIAGKNIAEAIKKEVSR